MRSVLRRPDFRLLFAGLIASMIGESILLVALAIWVKDLTGSDGMAGATLFAIVAPMVAAPLVGWGVDRFRRRPFFVAVNVLTAAALTPLLLVRDRGDVWLIYGVAVLYGLSYIAVSAALNGLLQQIVPGGLLAEANSALQTVKQGLRLGGPLAGAGLYAAVGGWALAAVAAAGFLIAAATVAALRVREVRPTPDVPRAARPRRELRWFAEVSAGMRHLVAEPALRRLLTGVGVTMLVFGFTESLIFAYVDQGLHRGAAFVGVLVSVQGIGGLLGGLGSAAVVRRLGEVGTAALGLGLFVPAALAMTYPSLLLALPAVVLFGAGIPLAVVGFNTLLQRRTASALLGRASAAADALTSGPQAASIGVGAILVSFVDYRLLFLVVGVVLAGAGLYLWRGRRLSPPAQAPAEASSLVSVVTPSST